MFLFFVYEESLKRQDIRVTGIQETHRQYSSIYNIYSFHAVVDVVVAVEDINIYPF